jgi:hypothetical protein
MGVAIMQTVAMWEDEDTNRKVSVEIDYEVDDLGISISAVTPQQVEFAEGRKVGVWTDAGQEMLRRQFRESKQYDGVISRLEESLLATTN